MKDFVAPAVPEDDRELFQALTSGDYDNFAILSVIHDGVPSTAIVCLTRENGTGDVLITPLFVRYKDRMDVRDPYGDLPVGQED